MATGTFRRFALTPEVAHAALRDPDLRRLQAAWMAVNAGRWAYLVTNLVVAYEAGGPAATGLLGLATFLAPTVLAPLSGIPTARWRPERVLAAVTALRAVAVLLTVALVALDGPLAALLLLVTLEAGSGAFTRPLHMAILPLIARTPSELVASNVAASAAEGIGTFAGPALSGLLIGFTGPAGSHLSVLVLYALAVVAIAGMRVPASVATGHVAALRSHLLAGARAAATTPAPRLLIGTFIIQTGVRGALVVLTVVAAIELLGMGEPGVGMLNAALGAGGFVGAVAAIALAGRPRLGPWVSVALTGWGLPIIAIGLVPHPAAALALMVVIGISNAVLDVAGFTLLQRTTPNTVRIAVLGLFDSLANGTQAVGGLLAPLLLVTLGLEGALAVTGLVLPILALATWPAIRRLDEEAVVDSARIAQIRADPLFAPLSMAIIEQLAGQLEPENFAAGQWILREGTAGDRYHIVREGRVQVSQAGRVVRECGPGEGLGEIALLRRVPRTASVRALTPVETLALGRDDFLAAVTGHPASRLAADEVVEARLASPPADRT